VTKLSATGYNQVTGFCVGLHVVIQVS